MWSCLIKVQNVPFREAAADLETQNPPTDRQQKLRMKKTSGVWALGTLLENPHTPSQQPFSNVAAIRYRRRGAIRCGRRWCPTLFSKKSAPEE